MFDLQNNRCKLILSSTLSAKENMKIDTQIFNSFTKEDLPIFRLYSWEKSCTIGISQKFLELKELESYKNNWAQRITGGGVLFHGNDISYSLTIPASYTKGLTVKQSYEKICAFLLRFYKNLGLDANFAKDNANIKLSKHHFCQVGFEPYDIIIDGKKIGGNAQRRSKNVIFQHGSIHLHKLSSKEEFGNSLDDFGIKLSVEMAQKKLIKAFEETFHVIFEKEN